MLLLPVVVQVYAYNRFPCTRSIRPQIQFPDCYIPPMDTSIPLTQASFLMSHNAATGYLPVISPKKPIVQALATYTKNQVGTIYDQLNSGARALDLRPKLLMNNTIVFHHGSVQIPVTLETVLSDVIRWCSENTDELVLLLPSNLQYEYSTYNDGGEAYVSAMSSTSGQFKIPYLHCNGVYGLDVGETMDLATLPSGGYALIMDQQDYYGSFCGKSNWIEDMLVTCYSYPILSENDELQSRYTNVRCTESKKDPTQPIASLKQYILSSANNEPVDNSYSLGPPTDIYNYPLNEIQALWQVDGHAITSGLQHLSSLLEDNRRSGLHSKLMQWIHNGELDKGSSEYFGISLLAVDNVALHGNALLSVIRNRCGQSEASICGRDIDLPKLIYIPFTKIIYWGLCVMFIVLIGVKLWLDWLKHRKKIRDDVQFIYNNYMLSA